VIRPQSCRTVILAIGEAKWGETMGLSHLERLTHIRALLTAQGRYGASDARLACYSAAGFTPNYTTAPQPTPASSSSARPTSIPDYSRSASRPTRARVLGTLRLAG
jgi:hypothetical protein